MQTKSKILRIDDVALAIGLSPSTIRNRLNPSSPWHDPTFPKPRRLSPAKRGAIGWRDCDIEAWVNGCEEMY